MDGNGIGWYFSGMAGPAHIPVFTLFGETTALPDVVHHERVRDRAGQRGWVIAPHRHSQMSQVLALEEGAARVSLDGQARDLAAGSYLYVPPLVVHGFAFEPGTEGAVLSVPVAVMDRLGPGSAAQAAWLSAPRQGRVPDEGWALIAGLARAYRSTGAFRAQRLVALTHAVLATLAEADAGDAAGAGGPGPQMQRLDALIAAHLSDGWTARDYARAMRVTTGHLNRRVRVATGDSLTAYLEAAVMAEACRLIAFTAMPVAEVGYRIGYGDPSYFSRRFRKRIGKSPTDYRQHVTGL
jgi:AraC family transcriptional activator of pobA